MGLGIRAILIAIFLIAVGAPLALFWFWPHSVALQKQIEEVRERHRLLAVSLGAALSTYHDNLVFVFGAFAPKIASGDPQEAIPLFENLHFKNVCVVDPVSGEVLRSFLSSQNTCPDRISSEQLQMFNRIGSSGKVSLSDVNISDGNKPSIYLIKSAAGLLVVGAIDTTFFQELQKRISFGGEGHAAIVDGNGRVLAHPLDEWARKALDVSQNSTVQRILAGKSGVGTFNSIGQAGQIVAGFSVVKETGWGVIVSQPLNELEDAAARNTRHVFLIFAAGLTGIALVALWISAQAAGRIKKVEAAAVQVAEGVDGVRLKGARSFAYVRELADLEEAFNRMAEEIEKARASDTSRNRALLNEISERQTAEAALQESEARFRNLFESEPIAIREEDFSQVKAEVESVLGDVKAFSTFLEENPSFVRGCAKKINVVDANVAAVKLYGMDEKEDLLGNIYDNMSDEEISVFKKILIAVHKGEPILELETVVKTSEGADRAVMARWSVVAGYETSYSRVLYTSIDITERRLTEERLKQAQKMEAVGQLTGGVAHDFNNLLAVIGGNADLLADDPHTNSSITDSIKLAVRRGSDLTQRLLAFSRQQPLQPKTINLGDLVSGMSDLLTRTLGATIRLKTSLSADLWEALADPGQVENAILNLAINARDAMPQGGNLTIECVNARLDGARTVEVSEDLTGDYVVLVVSDDGIGMPEEVLAHAFEPFFTTKEVGKGSGLGLSMVYGFAKQSGGNVSVYSEPSNGTTFRLYLPRSVEAEPRAFDASGDCDAPLGRGEKVLVIEDDPTFRVLAVDILLDLGYDVVDVADAASARITLIEQDVIDAPIDIVLSDVVLPGNKTGLEFAKEARALWPGLAVVFMSGYSAEAAVRNGFLGSDEILLTKPFERHQLAIALRKQLDATAA